MKKEIVEDDLRNPLNTYQTSFKFLKEDLERYREKGIGYECFQVLHPWTYDLDAVDFKYLLCNDLKAKIAEKLEGNIEAQVFWLSFFKPQMACAADDFFDAIRQLCEINSMRKHWIDECHTYELIMADKMYVMDLEKDGEVIKQIIQDFNN